ncbi:MAG: M1 family aminopeptidase, partial [Planctomycetota bacterium]
MYVYLLAIIIFYSGVLVWKERDARMDEVFDALPHPTWISYVAKTLVLVCVVALVLFAYISMGVANQAMAGYNRFQLGLYFKELYLISFVWIFGFIVLGVLIQAISPNKYVGYFGIVIAGIANVFLWPWLEVQSNLIRFTSLPSYIYSDMFQFRPFSEGLVWFGGYWTMFAILLSVITVAFWQRGKDKGLRLRVRLAAQRLNGSLGWVGLAMLLACASVGSWIYYNAEFLNQYQQQDEIQKLQAKYETDFKSLADVPQPRVTRVKHEIELYPRQRKLIFKGDQTIENQTDASIQRLILNVDDDFENVIEVENAKLVEEHQDVRLQIYEFDPPLESGQAVRMQYTVTYEPNGFENSVSQTQIVQNGTFFNNTIAPQIGYQPAKELSDKDDRKENELPEKDLMPALEPENKQARRNTYLSNSSDWLEIETIFSTSNDQIAVAPGSLIKKWEENRRRYFHYKLDHPSLNFYSFISADYEVALRQWNDVDIEVYYHKEHEWNVDKMLRSIRMSLEYYSKHFGPYKHKQARIIEFPRTASFAQAFPGTMPYSEGIGFIADIKEKDDIDMVYYVVAHEMAHQWWAHQVIGANMLGATFLSETLAQYSALMVMEKEYGRDIMRKFMEHEMDSYLGARGRETLKERPLKTVAGSQGYIHYNKGSVVMYYLKEIIGEENVNTALKSLVDRFGYQSHPYPTSQDLIDALAEQTPDKYKYLLDDLFTKITLFENRTLETNYRKLGDGKYEVTIDIECKKFEADDQGDQTLVPLDDWIEIGAFAEPGSGEKYGATLYRELVKMDQESSEYKFTVDQVPALAGVDPFLLMIDRFPDDNMKKPELAD